MKRIYFTIYLITFLTSVIIGAERSFIINEEDNRIELLGSFKEGGLRSGTDPIIVLKSQLELNVTFQKDLGLILINVTDNNGYIVYTISVNSNTQKNILIPLQNFGSGTYIIKFENDKGSMYGYFDI